MFARASTATLLALMLTAGCNRDGGAPAARPGQGRPTSGQSPARPNGGGPTAAPSNSDDPPTPPTANPPRPSDGDPQGPRADITADRYMLTAELMPSGEPNRPPQFNIEIRGATNYHVNSAFPIEIDLDVRNGTLAKTALRRGDAETYTNDVARFSQPVQGAQRGTLIHGRARFEMCQGTNCARESREFAVALD